MISIESDNTHIITMYEMEKMLAKNVRGFPLSLSLGGGGGGHFCHLRCGGIAIDLHLDSTLDQCLVY